MATQLDASVNSFWSLFVSDDPQVVLCETENDAFTLKARWETRVEVQGPFQHPRQELPLIQAAAEAARRLGQLASALDSAEQTLEVSAIRQSLIQAIRTVYPFDSVALADGSTWNLNAQTQRDPR